MSAHNEPAASTRKWRARVATAVFIAAMLALTAWALPRGFDADLGKIGAGKPVLVFVYDPNLLVSNQQTREMDQTREQLSDQLHFLVADVGRPDTQQFMRQHQAEPTQILLFAADGSLMARRRSLMTADELVRWLETSSAPR